MISRLPIFTVPVLVIILLGSGCAALPQSERAMSDAPGPPDQPMIMVDMQSPKKGGSQQKIPLASAPTLQAAVEQSRAASKFKRFHIAISRMPEHPGAEPQKLISRYDHLERRVPFEYDYHLQAGDRVVIVEDPSSTMDDMFGNILAPFRAMGGNAPVDKSPF